MTFTGNKSQSNEQNSTHMNGNKNKVTPGTEQICNSTGNNVDGCLVAEEALPLKSSCSENQTASTVTNITTVNDSSADDDNHTSCNDSNGCCSSSNATDSKTDSSTTISPVTAAPLCNGHVAQLSRDYTSAEAVGKRGEGKKVVDIHNKDIVGTPESDCCMSNAVGGGGEKPAAEGQRCQPGSLALGKSASLDSCDVDVEDMQLEGSPSQGECRLA